MAIFSWLLTRTPRVFILVVCSFFIFHSKANAQLTKADLARFKTNKEEFMLQRAEAIAQKRGVEKNKPFDPTKRVQAVGQMELQKAQRAAQRASQRLAPEATWTELGPNPIPNGQVVVGSQLSVSGRTTAIAVHPTNPDIVYVGTAQGGLYRTTDGGTTWTPLMDNAMSLAIGTIAIAPSSPETVYVGTGEQNFSVDSYFGVGIYRIDNASSASPTLSGPFNDDATNTDVFTGRSVSRILVHPTNPATIFVSTASGLGGIGYSSNATLPTLGIYRCTDATAADPTFTNITANGGPENYSIRDMVLDPLNPNLLVCNLVVNGGGIYRTTNALASLPVFTRTYIMSSNSYTEFAIHHTSALAPNPTIYAATGFNGGSVLRSLDGGATWTQQIDNNFCGGQCFYDIAIAVSPTDANRVYLGGDPTLVFGVSADGGATFTSNATTAEGLHGDSHAIGVSSSNPSIIYFGSDGGIYKSTNSGSTWASLNNSTFRATQFMGLAVHPTDANFTIGGTQDNGTNFLRPNATWNRIDYGDGGYAVIDQNATDTTNVKMYHTYYNKPYAMGYGRVTNVADATEGNWAFFGCGFGGSTPNGMTCSATSCLFYAPMEQGPGNPNTLYFGSDVLYRSADGGITMTKVSQEPIASGKAISAIGIAPQNDNVRLVGLSNGGVYGTITGASTLDNLDASDVIPNVFIARAVVDPQNVNTAYITLSAFGVASIWKTTNLNATNPTWTSISSGIPQVPVNAFLVDPLNSNTLYAGTDIGVYISENGGASWNPMGTGLPSIAVFDMAYTSNNKLRIATHGRGLWEIVAIPPVELTCPTNTTIGANQTQTAINTQFTTWLATATASGGCNGVLTNNNTGAPLASGGSTTVTFTYTSTCVPLTSTCQATFTVPPPVVLTCPINITTAACATTINTQFNTWLATATASGGCNGVLTNNNTGAPAACGGTTTVTFTYTSTCTPFTTTCQATFTVTAAPAAVLTYPSDTTIGANQTQTAINTQFNTWLATATASGGCFGTLSNNNSGAPPASGGSRSVLFVYNYQQSNTPPSYNCVPGVITRLVTFTVPPPISLTCPTNTTIGAGQTQSAINTQFNTWLATATASGGCNGVLTNNNTGAPSASGGSTTVTFTYTSTCAPLTTTCQATFTVPSPVVLTCPVNTTTAACQSQTAINTQFNTWLATAAASGGCNGVLTNNNTGAPAACGGTTTVTFTYTSTCTPLTTTCQATFTVPVTSPVVITCPAPVTVSCASAVPVVNTGAITIVSGCNVVITHLGDVVSAQTCANRYVISRTYRATDGCGNITDCTQTITVNDQTAPLITCPAPVTVSCAAAVPAPNIASVTGVSDNCGGTVTITWRGDVISGQTCANRYTITRTYRATDVCGNFTDCTQLITVNDQTGPVITCPANITATTPIGSCTAVVNYTVTATDNCGVVSVVSTIASGTAFPIGTTIVTSTATDACGNISTCSFTITVTDGQLPVITAQPQNRAVCAGQNATFSVSAITSPNANGALSYQWQNWNGSAWVNISGATASSYTVANATLSQNTNSYRVTVIGTCTTITSGNAILNVNPNPTVQLSTNIGPALLPNELLTIVATPSITGGTYQWFRNGIAMIGSVGSTLGPLSVTDAGTYRVVYTSSGCVATSNEIIVSALASSYVWIYPNPNNGVFNVRFFNRPGQEVTVRVFNAQGNKMYDKKVRTGAPYTTIQVNLVENKILTSGVYVVVVYDNNGIELESRKLVIYSN